MARPAQFPLALYRGDSYTWTFLCWSDFSGGTPADLTGVNAKAEIRDAPGGTVLATMTATITQPNTIVVKLPSTGWTTFTVKSGAWDLQLTYTTHTPIDVVTILTGAVTVTPDVTDSVPLSLTGAGRGRG